jgi:zinc D-Ala-D-Ala carboxypeptidase
MRHRRSRPKSPDLRSLGIPDDYGSARRLRVRPEARRIVSVGPSFDGADVKLAPAAARAWNRMRNAAAAAGVVLEPISGFRSIERQAEIVREKLAGGAAIEAILRVVAAPGYSEHHTGRAIDIGTPDEPPLVEGFADTPAFRWLRRHAGKFGFSLSFPGGNPHGISYEPWHWCHRTSKLK